MSGVISYKKANQSLPDKLTDKLILAYPNSVGAAAAVNGELKFVHSNEGADKEIMKLVQEDFGDTEVVFYMSDGKTKRSELDLQPYILLKDAQGEPMLVVMLEGDFSQFGKQGSQNSAEWFAVEEDILPRIRDTFDVCDSDITKTMEWIKTKVLFQRDIRKLWKDRGTVVFIANNGDIVSFDENAKKIETDWGWCSNPHGYTEAASQIHTTTASPKKFSLSNFKKAAQVLVNGDAAPTTEPVVEQKPSKMEPAQPPKASGFSKTKKAAPAVSPEPDKPVITPDVKTTPDGSVLIPKVELTEEEQWCQCPDHIIGNSAIQGYYRRVAGYLPDDHKDKPKVKISNKKLKGKLREKEQTTARSFREMAAKMGTVAVTATAIPQSVVDKQNATTAASTNKGTTPTGQEKEYPDTTNHHIPEEIEVGLLSADAKKRLSEFLSDAQVISALDKHSKIVADPAKMQKLEAKTPTFSELSGLDLEDLINWPWSIRALLIKNHPEAANAALGELAYHYFNLLREKGKKEITETTTSVPPTTQKSTSFSFGNKKKAVGAL